MENISLVILLIVSFVALGALIVIKIVAEGQLLPDGEIFGIVLAGLLGFLVLESIARVVTLVRMYRLDEVAVATTA